MTALDVWQTAVPSRWLLPGLNPLAKLAAPLPAMAVLVFVRDPATPLAFIALAYAVLFLGARLTARSAAILLAVVPAAALVLGVGMSLWADPSRIEPGTALVRVGDWALYSGAVAVGMATGLRLAAIIALALIAGLTTTGPDLVRAAVQQLRVPYRIGYTALAALRFVPRFGYELDVIRQAHRVRGTRGGVARWWGYIVPLLAGAIRHAERVALAMDARAFGAHADRTERHLVPWRRRDTAFVVVFCAASIGILLFFFPWTLD